MLKKFIFTITLILVFSLGWLSSGIFAEARFAGIESPLEFVNYTLNNSDKISPSDTINESDIWVYDDYAIINIPGLSLARYEDTNSMDPILDKEANGLEVVPSSVQDINLGDIIAYQKGGNLIVHRVINQSVDINGTTFFILKGDNNAQPDPEPVYFNQIEYKLVGVLY
jgi:hypothetical protein